MAEDGEAVEYGVVAREVLVAEDGLTFLRQIVDGELPSPPIAQTMGMHLAEADPGRVVFTGTPGFHHYNPSSQVHGGFALTLLDSALGCAVHSTLKAGESYTTLEIKVNFVRGMSEATGEVRSEGHVVHRGRQTATAEGRLTDANGRLLAHGVTTCMIFPAAN
ncbi:MAG: PaaI family thioesterase [Rhodobiaceae bacterium]|nr:PaaI family thioesterase [Rhodobiaceae bacterium]MCC0017240.1 PaaI family thioesterase [Rhodobiaceae bacterium]MCC0054396.1 PaaI family thioesterase [Rhodobiaceae bacterium]